jgi:hypothetical protein
MLLIVCFSTLPDTFVVAAAAAAWHCRLRRRRRKWRRCRSPAQLLPLLASSAASRCARVADLEVFFYASYLT